MYRWSLLLILIILLLLAKFLNITHLWEFLMLLKKFGIFWHDQNISTFAHYAMLGKALGYFGCVLKFIPYKYISYLCEKIYSVKLKCCEKSNKHVSKILCDVIVCIFHAPPIQRKNVWMIHVMILSLHQKCFQHIQK